MKAKQWLSFLKKDTTIYTLILVNIFPIIGVLFYDWSITSILFLYWLESGVIGLYTAIKMIIAGKMFAFIYVPFLLFHFGMFMGAHLVFILALDVFFQVPTGANIYGHHTYDNVDVLRLFTNVFIAFLFLLISHGISFVQNFLGHKEYKNIRVTDLMFLPYKRVILMQLTLIIGMTVTLTLNLPTAMFIFFILLKVYIDIRAHIYEHNPKLTGNAQFSKLKST